MSTSIDLKVWRSWITRDVGLRSNGRVVPEVCFNVVARRCTSETMTGVLIWLQAERLHKYWPLFSQLSYTEIVSLSEENISQVLPQLTAGARGRVLRCTERLRSRIDRLTELNGKSSAKEYSDVFWSILSTPLTSHCEPNGEYLSRRLLSNLIIAFIHHGYSMFSHPEGDRLLQLYRSRVELPLLDRILAQKILYMVRENVRRGPLPFPLAWLKLMESYGVSKIPRPPPVRKTSRCRPKSLLLLSRPSPVFTSPIPSPVPSPPKSYTQNDDNSDSDEECERVHNIVDELLREDELDQIFLHTDDRFVCHKEIEPNSESWQLSILSSTLMVSAYSHPEIPKLDLTSIWGPHENQVAMWT